VASHAKASQLAVARLLTETRATWLMYVQDDANIWVRRPQDEHEQAERSRKRKRGCRGRNVHSPCLNVVQHLFTTKSDGSKHACRLIAPTQLLPKTNWKTIQRHLHRWLLWNPSGVGLKWRGASVQLPFGLAPVAEAADNVQGHLQHCRWRIRCGVGDGIGTNACIERDDQLERGHGFTNGGRDVDIKINCRHHAAALSTKSFVLRLGKGTVASYLIRLGHLLENARTWDSLFEEWDKIVDDRFYFKICHTLSPEALEYVRQNEALLTATIAAGDMSPQDIHETAMCFPCDLSGDRITHLHPLDGTCDCGGTAVLAKARCKQHFRTCLGAGFSPPLLYRFKHWAMAAAWNLRARRMFRLLDHGLAAVFPAAKRKLAIQRQRLADGEMDFSTKSQVRAHATIKFIEKDEDMKLTHSAHMIPGPVNHYMNAAFAVEKLLTQVSSQMTINVLVYRAR